MRNITIITVAALFLMSGIYGCSSVPKKLDEEVKGIKSRVETLESRVEGVEARQVEDAQQPMVTEMESRVKTNFGAKPRNLKSREGIRTIQSCLKGAGFYTGSIDGVKGKKTKKAIREFQKASGLTPDGIVGKRTWDALSKFASGGAAYSEEGGTK